MQTPLLAAVSNGHARGRFRFFLGAERKHVHQTVSAAAQAGSVAMLRALLDAGARAEAEEPAVGGADEPEGASEGERACQCGRSAGERGRLALRVTARACGCE